VTAGGTYDRATHPPALIPSEACDRTHPDHEWWVGGRGWCCDQDCPDHAYGAPGSLDRRRSLRGEI
jgi:hypothetical protein